MATELTRYILQARDHGATKLGSRKDSNTPSKYEIKEVEIMKAVDGTSLACFFTKSYVFSNHFYRPNLIEIDGRKYICSEQYYMFYKARLFGDLELAHQILKANSPNTIKKLGSQIMLIACLKKFQQNSDLRKQLFDTDDALLVEASPHDKFWGVGMALDDPQLPCSHDWPGANVLGRLLTKIREYLKTDEKYNIT